MWQDIKNIYHLTQAVIANVKNGFPSRGLTVIGVTGTDGKTTTSSMIYHILKTAGFKTALISTVGAIIDGKAYDTGFHVTNPDSFAIQAYLKKAKKAGVNYIIIETTSHGLHQNRVFGVDFDIGVLTNITNEHLDYHKTYLKYVEAKARLFQNAKVSILNADDDSYSYIKPFIKNKKIITYGMKKNAEINITNNPFKLNLLGGFNNYNALAAIAAVKHLHVKDAVIFEALESFSAPTGRQEVMYDKDFKIIIDFAHTPGSFQAVLPDIKKITTNRLIHIFGCAGQRDAYKRPEMGKISSKYANIIILTAEDPRNEKVEDIISEIEKGILSNFNKKNLFKIPDRKKALHKALELAQKGDIVLITGKGHESSMNYGKGEEPWSEHEAIKETLNILNSTGK